MEAGIGMWAAALALPTVAGYLLGSINFAIIICHLFYKTDVRKLGSGNAGMTNVARNFGRGVATATLVGDVAKGILAVWIGRWAVMLLLPGADTLYGAYIGGICAILGHMFPVYFGFKGGKGVAVSGGVILALQPVLAVILVGIFLVIAFTSKMVSLGSVVGISLYPVVTLLWTLLYTRRAPLYSTICAAVIAGLVVWMHRSNIARIRNGTENKIGQKNKAEETGNQNE